MPADDRVLILDMRAAQRKRIAESLSRLGYEATFAGSVAAARNETFPIVIVELRGQPLEIAELHMQFPDSAIIAIGKRALAAALAAWHAGVDGYLPRPVQDEELAKTLAHILQARAARAAELVEARSKSSAQNEFRRTAAELVRQISIPLTTILGIADLLTEELPPHHPSREHAQAIIAAAIRIRDVAWMLADLAPLKE
ncbi:MAG TPA: hypothetical protein VFU22_12970 [Roseiflexaceae bacterium]|nr:hypothetical protein [Roseiflexaceae bacterium]